MSNVNLLVALIALIAIAANGRQDSDGVPTKKAEPDKEIRLGNFSISLSVKDIKASLEFYERLGFRQKGGNLAQNWVILQNETSTIGLFQGMFEKNSLTYNPGWDRDSKTLKEFDDVRDIQRELLNRGLELSVKADESTDGPAFFVLSDPDGNPILVDQHVPKAK